MTQVRAVEGSTQQRSNALLSFCQVGISQSFTASTSCCCLSNQIQSGAVKMRAVRGILPSRYVGYTVRRCSCLLIANFSFSNKSIHPFKGLGVSLNKCNCFFRHLNDPQVAVVLVNVVVGQSNIQQYPSETFLLLYSRGQLHTKLSRRNVWQQPVDDQLSWIHFYNADPASI